MVREFVEGDSTRIWELLNEIGGELNGVGAGMADGSGVNIRVGLVRVQAFRGSVTLDGSGNGLPVVTFPSAFSSRPGVWVVAETGGHSSVRYRASPVTATTARFIFSGGDASSALPYSWLAIGPA